MLLEKDTKMSILSVCENQGNLQSCVPCSSNPTFWAIQQSWNLQIVVTSFIVFQLLFLRFLNKIPGHSINITSQCVHSAIHLLKSSLTDIVLYLIFITVRQISSRIHLLFPPRKQILPFFILTPVQLSTDLSLVNVLVGN